MKRFILRLLLAYTIISVIAVVSVISISLQDRRESRIPRKKLYVVNMTGDSISVSISGRYTKEEMRNMNIKPDIDLLSDSMPTMPYNHGDGIERQAVGFHIPHKYDTEIEFPADFELHIKSAKRDITINSEQFKGYINGRYDRNWWVIYIYPQWLEPPKPEPVDTMVFVSNGIRYRYLPEPGDVEVIHGIPAYKDSVFIPKTVTHEGKTYQVTTIGDCAMAGGLRAFTYPNTIRHIGRRAFYQSTNLRRVAFPDSLRSIGDEAFSFCTVMESFTFPETVDSIGKSAFELCWNITSVTIPPRVSVIRRNTFAQCRTLKQVVIPQTVTAIERFAFGGCESLVQMEVYWQMPLELAADESPFKDTDLSRGTLTVPAGTKRLYQTAAVWKEFGKIEER